MLFRFMRFSERSGHGKPLFGAWYDAGTKNGFFHTKCGLRTLWALRSVDPLYNKGGGVTQRYELIPAQKRQRSAVSPGPGAFR